MIRFSQYTKFLCFVLLNHLLLSAIIFLAENSTLVLLGEFLVHPFFLFLYVLYVLHFLQKWKSPLLAIIYCPLTDNNYLLIVNNYLLIITLLGCLWFYLGALCPGHKLWLYLHCIKWMGGLYCTCRNCCGLNLTFFFRFPAG